MKSFDYRMENGTIKFWTDDETIRNKVSDYIEMVIDSENWRRSIQRVKRVEVEE